MEFRILGPLEAWDEGGEVSLRGSKPREVLAVLLLHANEVVSADRLIEELWGEDSPERAAGALRVNVSRLRKVLPRDVLTTRSSGYVVRVEPDALDLHRFERLVEEGRSLLRRGLAADASERLRQALSLWSGRALGDFAYERFAQSAMQRVDALLAIAEPLVRHPSRVLILARLVPDAAELRSVSAWLEERRSALKERGAVARAASFTSTAQGEVVARLAAELDVELLLADAPDELLAEGAPDEEVSALLEAAPCDVALLVPRDATPRPCPVRWGRARLGGGRARRVARARRPGDAPARRCRRSTRARQT